MSIFFFYMFNVGIVFSGLNVVLEPFMSIFEWDFIDVIWNLVVVFYAELWPGFHTVWPGFHTVLGYSSVTVGQSQQLGLTAKN